MGGHIIDVAAVKGHPMAHRTSNRFRKGPAP